MHPKSQIITLCGVDRVLYLTFGTVTIICGTIEKATFFKTMPVYMHATRSLYIL